MSNYNSIHTGSKIDDAVTKVNADNLVANKALVTDASKKLISTSVSDTELGFLSGVSSAIQPQLNSKEPTLTKGNLTSNSLSVTNGTNAVIGSGTTIEFPSTPIVSNFTITDLTASSVLTSDTDKQIVSSLVTIDDSGSVNIPNGQSYKINNSVLTYTDVGAAASSHSHGNISNEGAIGVTADLPIFTTTDGVLDTKSVADARTALGLGVGDSPTFNGLNVSNNTHYNTKNTSGSSVNIGYMTDSNEIYLSDGSYKTYVCGDRIISNVGGTVDFAGGLKSLDLTADRMVTTDSNKKLVTAYKVDQDLDMASTPVFSSLNINGDSTFGGVMAIGGVSVNANYGISINRAINNTNLIKGIYISDSSSVTTSGNYAKFGIDCTNSTSYVASGQTNNNTYGWVGANIDNFINSTNHQGTLDNQSGFRSTVGIYTNCGVGGTVTNTSVFKGTIQNGSANGTITNAYILYGNYSGTAGIITNKWGLYLLGETKNQISGNINIGSGTLSDWSTAYKTIEFYDSAIMGGNTSSNLYLLSNAYYDGEWKYKVTAASSYYLQGAGVHKFKIAPSGVASTPITWIEALTIDNSGNSTFGGVLALGGATANSNYKLNINKQSIDVGGSSNIYISDYSYITATAAKSSYGLLYQSPDYYVPTGVTNSSSSGLVGVYSQSYIDNTNHQGTLDNQYGLYGQAGIYTSCGTGGTITHSNGVRSVIFCQSANATIINGYLYRGEYYNTAGTITNKYGLYLTGDSLNQMSGVLALGGATANTNYGINMNRAVDNTNNVSGINIVDTSSTTSSGAYTKFGCYYTSSGSYVASGQTNSSAGWIGIDTLAIINSTSHQGTLTNQCGGWFESGIHNNCGVGGTVTNSYGTRSQVHSRSANGTITNAYLYYGNYNHTAGTVTNKWGLYLTGETKNQISGNLNIGSGTLSAWSTGWRSIEFYGSSIMANNSSTDMYLTNNAYYDGVWKYKISSDEASCYAMANGSHEFRIASSGTADTSITWTTALTIDNSANALFNGASAETSQVGGINLKQGTNPSTSTADQITIFATSGASCTLGLRTEATVTTESVTSDRTLAVKINGTVYKLCLKA